MCTIACNTYYISKNQSSQLAVWYKDTVSFITYNAWNAERYVYYLRSSTKNTQKLLAMCVDWRSKVILGFAKCQIHIIIYYFAFVHDEFLFRPYIININDWLLNFIRRLFLQIQIWIRYFCRRPGSNQTTLAKTEVKWTYYKISLPAIWDESEVHILIPDLLLFIRMHGLS